jgi:hypothetical protein
MFNRSVSPVNCRMTSTIEFGISTVHGWPFGDAQFIHIHPLALFCNQCHSAEFEQWNFTSGYCRGSLLSTV